MVVFVVGIPTPKDHLNQLTVKELKMYVFPKDETKENLDDNGITLRDYFAAKAMQIILDWHKETYFKPEQEWVIAKAAYQMANAMIEVKDHP